MSTSDCLPAAPVVVLGLGGIGGIVAARTGAIVVGTERTVAAVRTGGLALVHGGATTVSHPEAVERLERRVGLLVVAVKAYDLDAALGRIAPHALHGAVVLPLLNGLEHVELIRRWLQGLCVDSTQSAPHVIAGSIGRVEALSPEPGVVVQRTCAVPVVTVASSELDRATLAVALAPLAVPGLELLLAGDERAVLWEKAVRLAVLAAATVASGSPVGALRDADEWGTRLRAGVREACAVAAADGVTVDPAGQWAIIEAMAPDLTTSAARDAAAGRPTELDAITGSVVRAGRRLGVPTPVLDALLADAEAQTGGRA